MRIRSRLDHPGYRPPWRLAVRPLAYALAAIAVWLWATQTLTMPLMGPCTEDWLASLCNARKIN
jgi:hypothetical protein